jgi:16S rRNA processing protein RimM
MILLGRIAGAFGVHGELRIESWTEPRNAIFRYRPWTLRLPSREQREAVEVRGRGSDNRLIAQLPDITDRDMAEAMRGTGILVPRSALPPARPGEFYWVDLEGLRVVTLEGVELGIVSHLFSTGANDVMMVQGERERMLPFARPDYVHSVDFETGVITVDWDPEF